MLSSNAPLSISPVLDANRYFTPASQKSAISSMVPTRKCTSSHSGCSRSASTNTTDCTVFVDECGSVIDCTAAARVVNSTDAKSELFSSQASKNRGGSPLRSREFSCTPVADMSSNDDSKINTHNPSARSVERKMRSRSTSSVDFFSVCADDQTVAMQDGGRIINSNGVAERTFVPLKTRKRTVSTSLQSESIVPSSKRAPAANHEPSSMRSSCSGLRRSTRSEEFAAGKLFGSRPPSRRNISSLRGSDASRTTKPAAKLSEQRRPSGGRSRPTREQACSPLKTRAGGMAGSVDPVPAVKKSVAVPKVSPAAAATPNVTSHVISKSRISTGGMGMKTRKPTLQADSKTSSLLGKCDTDSAPHATHAEMPVVRRRVVERVNEHQPHSAGGNPPAVQRAPRIECTAEPVTESGVVPKDARKKRIVRRPHEDAMETAPKAPAARAEERHVEESTCDEGNQEPGDAAAAAPEAAAGSNRAWRRRPKYPVRQISRRAGAEVRKVDELLREIDEEYDSIMGPAGNATRHSPAAISNGSGGNRQTQAPVERLASPKRSSGIYSTSSPRATGNPNGVPPSPLFAFTNAPNATSTSFFHQNGGFIAGDEPQANASTKGPRGQRQPSGANPNRSSSDGKIFLRLSEIESGDAGTDGPSGGAHNEVPAGTTALPPLAPSRTQPPLPLPPQKRAASVSAEDSCLQTHNQEGNRSSSSSNPRGGGCRSTERARPESRRTPSAQRSSAEFTRSHSKKSDVPTNDSAVETGIVSLRRGSAPCRPTNNSRRGSMAGNSSSSPFRGSPMRYRNARASSTKPIPSHSSSSSSIAPPRFQPLVPLDSIRLFVSTRGGDGEEPSGKVPPEEGRANDGDEDPNDDENPGDGANGNGNDKGSGRPQGRGKRRGNGGDRSDDDDDNGDDAPVEDDAWTYTPPPNNQRTFVFPEDNISFSSEFDSGNLIQMERVGPFRYNMWSCQDCGNTPYQTNNRQWFHFAVRGGSKGVNVTVTMIGLMHSMMFTFGWSPVMCVMPGGKGDYVRLPWKPTVVSLDEMPPTPGYPMLVHKVWPKDAKRAAAAAAAAATATAAATPSAAGTGEDGDKGADAASVVSPNDAAPSPDTVASPTTNEESALSPTTATPTTATAASPNEQTGADAAVITVAAPTAAKRTKKKDTVAMNITFDFTIDSDVPLNSPFSLDDPNCPAIFIASNHPYPYCRLQRAITQWASLVDSIANQTPSSSPVYFHRETLCESLDGRNVDVLTITDTSGMASELEPLLSEVDGIPVSSAKGVTARPNTFPKKRYVVLTARVHPGECPASHMMHGCIEFLMNRKDPRAAALRQNFVFVLVPMINPDGVARGHSRSDSCGINLNRMYRNPSKKRHPAAYCIREMARSLAKTQRLAMFIDMHAHANKRGTFIYGNAMDADSQVQNILYTKLVSLNTPYFDFTQCNLSETNMFAVGKSGEGKDHSSRVTVFQDTGLIHCYTIEASHVAGTQYMNPLVALPTIPGEESDILPGTLCPKYSPATFADTGRGLLVGLLDLVARNPVTRLTCTQFGSTRGVAQWINRQIHIEVAEALFKLAFSSLGGADVLRNGLATATATAPPADGAADNKDATAGAGAAQQLDPLNKVLSVLTHESIPNVMTVRDSRSLPPFTVKNVRSFTAPDIVKQLLAQVPAQGPPRSLISGTRASRGARGASPANPQPPQAGAGKRAKLTRK